MVFKSFLISSLYLLLAVFLYQVVSYEIMAVVNL